MKKLVALIGVTVLVLLGGGYAYVANQESLATNAKKMEFEPLITGFETRWNANDMVGLYNFLNAKEYGMEEMGFISEIGERRTKAGMIKARNLRSIRLKSVSG